MTGLPGCAASALRHKAAMAGQGEISFHMASWQGDTSSSQHPALIFFSFNSYSLPHSAPDRISSFFKFATTFPPPRSCTPLLGMLFL